MVKEVFGERVNFLIDSGVGCILSKKFLNKLGKSIDAATNVKIIDVNGKKTAPLGIVRQVSIKIRDIETTMDALITESGEYNILVVGNQWMKKVKAKADWKNDELTITYNDITHEIPITCTQQMDPNKFIALDYWKEELELEEDDDMEKLYASTMLG